MSTKYLLGLWMSTLLMGPIVYGIYDYYFYVPNTMASLLDIYPLTLMISIFFSLPTLSVAYLTNLLIKESTWNLWTKKIAILSLCLIGINITMKLEGGALMPYLRICYCISLIMAALFIEIINRKLPTTKNKLH